MRRFCPRCKRATDHREIRSNVFGQEGESPGHRLLLGAISLGGSEVFAETSYECNECGRRTDAA